MYDTVMPPDTYHADFGDITSSSNFFTNHTNQPSVLPHQVFVPCNNPRNIVSPHVAEMVELVLYAGILPILVTYGVITNVINMVVFVQQGLSDRINLCLFSLAVSDTGFLLFLMCSKSYAVISLVDPEIGNYWGKRYAGTILANCLGFLVLSNVTTAVIAVERCICVLIPLKAARIFKTKYMAILIVVVGVYIQTVLSAAFSLRYQAVEVTDPLTNTSTYISRMSPFYLRHRTIIDIIYSYLILVTLPLFSLVVVIVCTTIIIFRLKVTATWRQKAVSKMTSVAKQEVKVTRMLVTVCVVYVTCTTPAVIKEVAIFSRVPGFMISDYLCNLFKVCVALSRLIEVVNASSNFLIYIRQSSRYQSTLWRLCPFWLSSRCRKLGGGSNKFIDLSVTMASIPDIV